MTDINYASVCGVYCENCEHLNKACKGCGYEQGKTFWENMMPLKICPLYDCCRNKKNIEHCGLCNDFPCKMFVELREPNMSDEKFRNSLTLRQSELKKRTDIGTSNWLKAKSTS